MIKKVFRKTHRILSRFLLTDKKIKKMIQSDDQVVRNMGMVFKESLANDLSEREEEFVNQIENLRNQYVNSGKFIEPDELTPKESLFRLAKVASKKKNWGILISKIIKHFKVQNSLELGTCIGISTSYHAFALQSNEGNILTLEGSISRVNQAKKTFETLKLSNIKTKQGNFNKVLPEVLQGDNKFDYVFIDGDHSYDSTVGNFKKILAHTDKRVIILVDDIQWSSGMMQAWNEISEHESSTYVFNLYNVGIIITGQKNYTRKFKMALW